jgi:hypothetical protein
VSLNRVFAYLLDAPDRGISHVPPNFEFFSEETVLFLCKEHDYHVRYNALR